MLCKHIRWTQFSASRIARWPDGYHDHWCSARLISTHTRYVNWVQRFKVMKQAALVNHPYFRSATLLCCTVHEGVTNRLSAQRPSKPSFASPGELLLLWDVTDSKPSIPPGRSCHISFYLPLGHLIRLWQFACHQTQLFTEVHLRKSISGVINQMPSMRSKILVTCQWAMTVRNTSPAHASLRGSECYGMFKRCMHTCYFDTRRAKWKTLKLGVACTFGPKWAGISN